jgi:hypothetical protein
VNEELAGGIYRSYFRWDGPGEPGVHDYEAVEDMKDMDDESDTPTDVRSEDRRLARDTTESLPLMVFPLGHTLDSLHIQVSGLKRKLDEAYDSMQKVLKDIQGMHTGLSDIQDALDILKQREPPEEVRSSTTESSSD